MALDSLPQLDAARLRVDAARQRVSVARAAYAPTSTLRAGGVYAQDNFTGATVRSRSLQALGSLHVEVVDFGRRRHALKSAKASVSVAGAELELQQLGAVETAVLLYLTVLRDERRIRDAQYSVTLQESQVAAIRRLVAHGARPEVDLQRAEIQLQAARDNVVILQSEAQRDRVDLALSIGVDGLQDATLAPLDEDILAIPGERRSVEAALGQRPELRGAHATVLALEELAASSGAARAPTLTLDGTAGYTRTLAITGPEPSDRVQATASAFITWNGLDALTWTTHRARVSDAAAAQRDAHAVRREVRALVLEALREHERTQAAVERAQHLRDGTRAALDAQKRRYELGAASLIELLDAQSLEQQARAELIDAELSQSLARAQVLSRCGLLQERARAAD
jgi:outer membrane protein TolC